MNDYDAGALHHSPLALGGLIEGVCFRISDTLNIVYLLDLLNMSFMLNRRVILVVSVGAGAGALIGSAVTWWLVRRSLYISIVRLVDEVERLSQVIERLQRTLEGKAARKLAPSSSADEDDDLFEDAYGG
jgi:hypothetical protein